MTQTHSLFADAQTALRLGQNHGYRIDGDLACLNAELALTADRRALAQRWALQLWACDAPYGGGALSGTKVAEAPLELSRDAEPQQLYAEAFARLPAGAGNYSMVLVLASGETGTFDRVHDFANYPEREHFTVPALRGVVAHVAEGDEVSLRVERVENPRDADNLSGTLALELWALETAYHGGQFVGTPLAGVELGRLAGQQAIEQLERRTAMAAVPVGFSHHVLMLREWTANGYVTRDFRDLSVPALAAVTTPEAVRHVAPEAVVETTPEPAAVSVKVVEPVAETRRVASAPEPAAESVRDVSQPTQDLTVAKAEAKTEPAPSTALISIQHGTLDELTVVPGLNRKLAMEIIKARPYRSFEDLMRVRGVGEKTLRKLRSVLTL